MFEGRIQTVNTTVFYWNCGILEILHTHIHRNEHYQPTEIKDFLLLIWDIYLLSCLTDCILIKKYCFNF